MVSLAMRRVLVGLTAVAVALGWLQLPPAFGFPATAPAAMLDRMLGAHREAGSAGWALLLLGEFAFVAVERSTGAAILDHQVVLRGLCRDCRELSGKSGASA